MMETITRPEIIDEDFRHIKNLRSSENLFDLKPENCHYFKELLGQLFYGGIFERFNFHRDDDMWKKSFIYSRKPSQWDRLVFSGIKDVDNLGFDIVFNNLRSSGQPNPLEVNTFRVDPRLCPKFQFLETTLNPNSGLYISQGTLRDDNNPYIGREEVIYLREL